MEVINTLGRRKTSVARVYMKSGKGNFVVNGKEAKEYFPTSLLQDTIRRPFHVLELDGKYDVKVNVSGGGITGQAEAISLAIARALVKENGEVKPKLKQFGLMTRDPRMVERKKFGQKKARKKFQFSKR
ncbi:MAG: 30S ribosomal protein S9 [Flavobacteriales bacterium]|nr:30S ribosomal protein S9 [Flavobacteriales bacterium]MCB9190888.1 30S ribosomal protein S9 [Flavobacteriales bacterium]MCB9205361.1 30S ribosomal protein S9 [Flavobacteriales bacterium]